MKNVEFNGKTEHQKFLKNRQLHEDNIMFIISNSVWFHFWWVHSHTNNSNRYENGL